MPELSEFKDKTVVDKVSIIDGIIWVVGVEGLTFQSFHAKDNLFGLWYFKF